jgi:RNA polymerase sigma-70 factor (ECF subfamily)
MVAVAPEPHDFETSRAFDAAPTQKEDLRKALIRVLPRVRNLVRYLVPGDQEADDIAQEALVKAVRWYGSFRGDAPFERWMDRIVVHTTFRWLRDRSRSRARVASIATALEGTLETGNDAYLSRRYVVELLDSIAEPQRHCLVLRHVVGMSISEIAETLKVPAETVRSRLRLGRHHLRERDCGLADSHFDEDDDDSD